MTAWTEPKRSYSFYAISICSFVYIYFTPLGVQEYVRTPDYGTGQFKNRSVPYVLSLLKNMI